MMIFCLFVVRLFKYIGECFGEIFEFVVLVSFLNKIVILWFLDFWKRRFYFNMIGYVKIYIYIILYKRIGYNFLFLILKFSKDIFLKVKYDGKLIIYLFVWIIVGINLF